MTTFRHCLLQANPADAKDSGRSVKQRKCANRGQRPRLATTSWPKRTWLDLYFRPNSCSHCKHSKLESAWFWNWEPLRHLYFYFTESERTAIDHEVLGRKVQTQGTNNFRLQKQLAYSWERPQDWHKIGYYQIEELCFENFPWVNETNTLRNLFLFMYFSPQFHKQSNLTQQKLKFHFWKSHINLPKKCDQQPVSTTVQATKKTGRKTECGVCLIPT